MDNGVCAGDVGKFESALYDEGRRVAFESQTQDTMKSIVREQMAKLSADDIKPFTEKVNQCSLSRHDLGHIEFCEIKFEKK